ncbi:early nodulin-like protein 8 [Typha angustifolia]|uniref:early nodulin-like protein 8 n=1 Tax=Typha angustifolia TaxID=59011 RepID=UPI003C2C3C92
MHFIPSLFFFFLVAIHGCSAIQYKVGDLDAWGVPPPSKSNLYSVWSQSHHFRLGDSLLFLYPPSQDSVVQVSEKEYNSCAALDPILRLDDGNSVFNLTTPGRFYFISGVSGHCEKLQKLAVDVPNANGTFFPPSEGSPGSPAASPSSSTYPIVFGPSAAQESGAGKLGAFAAGGSVIAMVLLTICAL